MFFGFHGDSHTDEPNMKNHIDRRPTQINISDEMIDDRISKSLRHQKKNCICLRVSARLRY